jgi:hypothetical protein
LLSFLIKLEPTGRFNQKWKYMHVLSLWQEKKYYPSIVRQWLKRVRCMFNSTNVELNMCISKVIHIPHGRKSSWWLMYYLSITEKRRSLGEPFKLSQQYSSTSIVSCWIVTWTGSKDKRKLYMNQKSRLQAWLAKV